MTMFTRVRAAVVALVVGLAGLVAAASPASAHHPTVQGEAVCDTATGLFDITWTVGNSETDKVMTYGSRLGGGTVQPNPATATVSEGDVAAGTHTLQVDASWPNGVTASATGSVTAGGECAAPEQRVAPVGVDVAPPTCDTDGVGTVPAQPEGVTVTPVPGSYGPGTYDVVFTAEAGYVLAGDPSGTMTVLPATGRQSEDPDDPCYEGSEPETRLEPRSDRRADCQRVERRTWNVVLERDETTGEWVRTGIRDDSGWVVVRPLTLQEKVARGCVEVEGEQETDEPDTTGSRETPQPSRDRGATAVPTVVAAGA